MTNINWNEKPEWADVWIEDKECPEYSGWHKDRDAAFIDDGGGKYLKCNISKDLVISYPPTKGWNAEGLPLIGEECHLKPYWHKVTIIAHHDSEEGTRIVFWDHHDLVYGSSHRPDDFRTFKIDKEKWVDQVIRIYDEKDEGARENFARLYDAMQSGKLPAPKGIKYETNYL